MPWLVVRFVLSTKISRKISYRKAAPYLLVAAGVWAIGFWLPNIPVTIQSDSFSLHTAGGVAAGILWMFILKAYGIRFGTWWHAPLSLYAFVSSLGVLNELFEVLLNLTGWENIYNLDAQWDLVANTFGAGLVFVVWLCSRIKR